MNILWKGVAAISLALAGIGATAAPAQAQYYGGHHDGWRGDRGHRVDNRRWDNHRRWDNRRSWDRRGHGYRSNHRYRQRCWTEWRYDRWRHRDVRVRRCR
jgi:hypothetical protein